MINVNGEKHSWYEGMTVADLILSLSNSYNYPVIRINDQYVSKPNFETTMLPDNSDVFLLPMISGG
jgi:thiamine biosynthesis protein ThiS